MSMLLCGLNDLLRLNQKSNLDEVEEAPLLCGNLQRFDQEVVGCGSVALNGSF